MHRMHRKNDDFDIVGRAELLVHVRKHFFPVVAVRYVRKEA